MTRSPAAGACPPPFGPMAVWRHREEKHSLEGAEHEKGEAHGEEATARSTGKRGNVDGGKRVVTAVTIVTAVVWLERGSIEV